MNITQVDKKALENAKQLLECVSLAEIISSKLGNPVDYFFKKLPISWNDKINNKTNKCLIKMFDKVIYSVDTTIIKESSDKMHKMVCITTGCAGGFLGSKAILIELAVSLSIMMRSIIDIARSEGENLDDLECKLSCMQVFSMGSNYKNDSYDGNSYYQTRLKLNEKILKAAVYLEKGVAIKNAPELIKFINDIASKLSIKIGSKASAQIVPVIGAVGGAAINYVFIEHIQNLAHAHFTIRRLERKYGPEYIRDIFENVKFETLKN